MRVLRGVCVYQYHTSNRWHKYSMVYHEKACVTLLNMLYSGQHNQCGIREAQDEEAVCNTDEYRYYKELS